MLDTLQVKHFFRRPFSDDHLLEIGSKQIRRGNLKTFALNPEKNSPLPKITFTFPPNALMHVSAGCSIPKLMFGHNAVLPNQDEVNEGLQCLCDYVEARTGLQFEAETATVSQIHYAKDYRLGEPDVYRAIRNIAKQKLIRYDSLLYNGSTLYFNAKGKAAYVRIYPKFAEVRAKKGHSFEALEASRGVLRIEYCLVKPARINALVNSRDLPDKTVKSLITAEISDSLISDILCNLHFAECLTEERSNLEILLSKYPRANAYRLNSFLQAINLYGENFYLDPRHGFSKFSYDRDARECRKARVWVENKSLE